MIEFANFREMQRWLDDQPSEVALVIGARVALRVLPLMFAYHGRRLSPTFFGTKALPVFRAVAVSWAAANSPNRGVDLREAGDAAARAVWTAHEGTGVTKSTCFGAAYQAAYRAARGAHDPALDRYAMYPPVHAEACTDALYAAAADAAIFEVQGYVRNEFHRRASEVGRAPLWMDAAPGSVTLLWARLKGALLTVDEGWGVWTEWYEDRVAGRAADIDLELARVMLPDGLWRRGPKTVNDTISRLIEERRAISDGVGDLIPPQGAGPHFTLSPAHLIALAAPVEIDAAGNNIARIRQLLPLARRAAGDLVGHLNPNAFPELARNVGDYRAALAFEPKVIAWGVVFGLGLMLENAATAARRQIEDRLQPPLEDAAQAALESLLTLHGPLILATAEGRDLSDQADRMRLTREQQAKLRTEVEILTDALKEDVEIIERPAADLVVKATEVMDQGDHPERGTIFGIATVKNVAIVLVSAAAVSAVGTEVSGLVGPAAGAGAAWLSLESLKTSKVFRSATEAIGSGVNQLLEQGEVKIKQQLIALAPFRRFVLENEGPLRRISANTTQFRWVSTYIDLIVRTKQMPGGNNQPG